jgi:serine/threonine-protein kinase
MTSEAALSRKMLARAVEGSSSGDEDARGFLQRRLEVYSRVVAWSFVALRAIEVVLYRTYPQVKPRLYAPVFTTGIVGLIAMAVCWRALLVRRTLSMRHLERYDLAYTASSGLVFGATALLAYDRHESAYTCLVYACLVVFTRALVVPSSGAWTLKVSAISFAPLVISAGVLGAQNQQEVPGAAYFLCAAIYSVIAVTIATAGSRFMYGLRRKIRERARLGRYTLGEKIGEGGMGAVYRAHHELLRRPCAIKLLHPERLAASTLDRFEGEVQHMSQLTHPNTVAVFDYGHNLDGVFYYAMEYLDGLDLERLVRDHGPQPIGRVIDILVQVCGALHEAHLRGLVHRDVKPANIILCERGGNPDVAKVVDFGLARGHGSDGSIVGTPAYLAPEAISLPASVGPAADIYALGAVAFFLLTGKRVFTGDSVEELCQHHVATPPTAPGVAPAVDAVILACLAKDPTQRPASARELARRLRAVRPAIGWTAEDARAWWRDRATDLRPSASTPSIQITIDLDARLSPERAGA